MVEQSHASLAKPSASLDGQSLIITWINCVRRVKSLNHEIVNARNDAARAKTNLALWLMPKDPQPGEKVGIWYGDSLLVVEKHADAGPNDFEITIRERGKSISELGG